MPAFLAAADAAVSFMKPAFSKKGCSPTKVPEYLAMGLPVVMNRGIGDCDQLIHEVSAVIDAGNFQTEEVERAADQLLALALGAALTGAGGGRTPVLPRAGGRGAIPSAVRNDPKAHT